MGLGPSNLVILRSDEDIRKLEWGDIEEELAFFRRWDMEDVSSALKKFKGLKRALDKNRPPLNPDDSYDLVNRRTNWSEYYKICYDVDTTRQRKLDERERAVWHPATQSFAMSADTAALDAYDEYILGDTVRKLGDMIRTCIDHFLLEISPCADVQFANYYWPKPPI